MPTIIVLVSFANSNKLDQKGCVTRDTVVLFGIGEYWEFVSHVL